jgi:predicted anti-sigma-YlaC factor YlaD
MNDRTAQAPSKAGLATRWSVIVPACLLLAGCSVRQLAIKQLGAALAESAGGAFAAEEDVEFAGQAVPFSLKLIESLILEQPENTDLLTAAAAGFTQYSYVWVQQPADFIEDEDFAQAQRDRARAKAFYLRAHRYAMRGLDAAHPGLAARLAGDSQAALDATTNEDLPLLYWAAASLGSAISLGKTEPELVARQTQFAALLDRAYALNPDWDDGAVRELKIAYELSRPGGGADAFERVRRQFDRLVELGNGLRASPFVSLAESVSVQQQNRQEFIELLNRALAIDPDRTPAHRLANVVAQQRARWLLERVDELFLE